MTHPEYQDPSEWVYRIVAGIHAMLALVIVCGGAGRFPPPTYATLLELSGGHAWPYAVPFAIAAPLMCMNRPPWRAIGLTIGFTSMYWFGSLFAVAAINYPPHGGVAGAALTAPVAYFGFGILDAFLLGHKISLWKRGER